jgi:hypothetical protein
MALDDGAFCIGCAVFTVLPYFWHLMMRAATSEYYLPGSVPPHLYQTTGVQRGLR